MKVVIALPDDKIEERIVNAGYQYKFIFYYQLFSHTISYFSNNVDPLAHRFLSRYNCNIFL